jgi:hypothetical protein
MLLDGMIYALSAFSSDQWCNNEEKSSLVSHLGFETVYLGILCSQLEVSSVRESEPGWPSFPFRGRVSQTANLEVWNAFFSRNSCDTREAKPAAKYLSIGNELTFMETDDCLIPILWRRS